jgi:hypothetical protein
MLLNEIIQTDIRNINLPNRKFKPSKAQEDSIGKGRYSTVRNDPKDPHMVIKKTKFDKGTTAYHNKDVYPQFIDALINSDQKMNPYFPRIYGMKSYTDKSDDKLNKFNIEKLEDLRELSAEEMDHIIGLIMDDDVRKAWKVDNERMLAWFISEAIKKNSVRKEIKDRNLYNALTFLSEFLKKNWFLDLHSENMMFRRTPYGPQLVITDPFSQESIQPQDAPSSAEQWV